jgi:hypothetical protein
VPKPPRRLLVAVWLTILAALLVFVAEFAAGFSRSTGTTLLLAGEFAVALLFAQLLPIHLAPRTRQTVTTTSLFVATLLLPVPLVMIGAVALQVAADRRRVRWFQTAFNAAQFVLVVAAGAGLFRLLAGTAALHGQVTNRLLPIVVLTGLTMYATNKLLVSAIVAVQQGAWRFAALRRQISVTLVEEAVLLLLGVLAAVVAGPSPALTMLPLAGTLLVQRELVAARRRQDATESGPSEAAATEALAYRPITSLFSGF